MQHTKTPFRAKNEISQSFNDGVVEICSVTDSAPGGRQPRPRLTLKVRLHYAERAFGVRRNYEARQNNIQIEKVIRCMAWGKVNNQDVAVIGGVQYRIDTVNVIPDICPPSVDLTLARMEQIPTEEAADALV